MIDYVRSSWYGWGYLCMHWVNGSVMPKTLPPMILAGGIGAWAASPAGIAAIEKYDTAREMFGETYGMQVFGIVFGYLCIARLNVCYARYWEGVTHVKMMHSKWSDAAAQACAFDRVQSHSLSIEHEPFCRHLVHLFSQLSAMAMMSLHVNKAGLAGAANGVNLDWLRSKDKGTDLEPDDIEMLDQDEREVSLREDTRNHDRGGGASTPSSKGGRRRRRHAEALNDSFTKAELDFYDLNRGCAVHTTVNRIIRSLTTRQNAGGLPFAPPIISRIYQELSNGLLAYNQAIKLKEIPV